MRALAWESIFVSLNFILFKNTFGSSLESAVSDCEVVDVHVLVASNDYGVTLRVLISLLVCVLSTAALGRDE